MIHALFDVYALSQIKESQMLNLKKDGSIQHKILSSAEQYAEYNVYNIKISSPASFEWAAVNNPVHIHSDATIESEGILISNQYSELNAYFEHLSQNALSQGATISFDLIPHSDVSVSTLLDVIKAIPTSTNIQINLLLNKYGD